jgi:hypothetical protein
MFLLCYIRDKGQSWGAIGMFYCFLVVGMGGIVKIRKKKKNPLEGLFIEFCLVYTSFE